MTSSPYRIIHATDIHYSEKSKSHVKEVMKALKDDLAEIVGSNEPCLLIVSGDIAYSGDNVSQYTQFADLILDLAASDNITTCTVPGNHDVSQKFISQNYANIIGISENNTGAQEVSDYLDGQEDFLKLGMSSFIDFETYFDGLLTCQNSLFGTGYPLTDDMGIFLLNSGFSSFAGLEYGSRTSDYGHLLLNLNPLKQWINDTSGISKRILTLHHPLPWFREDIRNELARLIDLHFGLVLLGHEHEPKFRGSHGYSGHSSIILQGGALASEEHHRQFYQIIDFDFSRNSIKSSVRHFSKSLVNFNPGTTITGTPTGALEYSPVWTSKLNEQFQPAMARYSQASQF